MKIGCAADITWRCMMIHNFWQGEGSKRGQDANFICACGENTAMKIDSLVEIGLTRREANAYVALLGLEEARAGEVARQLSEDRANAYDSLASLVKKGLASFVVRGKATYYRAAPPERLKDLMFEKDKALYQALSELSKIYRKSSRKAVVRTFEGRDGIKAVLSDILRQGKEIVGFGATDRMAHLFPEFAARYLRERERRGITSRQFFAQGNPILPCRLTQYKMMPRDFSGPASTVIYGDKVAILLWFTEPPVAVLIESPEAASAYRQKFEFMWRMVKARARRGGK
jgi:sugar-specific transcriptional regulator TrmB